MLRLCLSTGERQLKGASPGPHMRTTRRTAGCSMLIVVLNDNSCRNSQAKTPQLRRCYQRQNCDNARNRARGGVGVPGAVKKAFLIIVSNDNPRRASASVAAKKPCAQGRVRPRRRGEGDELGRWMSPRRHRSCGRPACAGYWSPTMPFQHIAARGCDDIRVDDRPWMSIRRLIEVEVIEIGDMCR